MQPAEYVWASLAIPLWGNKPRRELRRQAINKHIRGRTSENRKSNPLSSPQIHHCRDGFSKKTHKPLVWRGAYKQIIGALIDEEKLCEYTSALDTNNDRVWREFDVDTLLSFDNVG